MRDVRYVFTVCVCVGLMGEWLTQFCGGSFVFQHLKQLERKVRTLEVHKDRVSEVSLSPCFPLFFDPSFILCSSKMYMNLTLFTPSHFLP